MLSDEARGATMEAVVSRMKTVQATISRESASATSNNMAAQAAADWGIRFVAVSATIPNTEDVSMLGFWGNVIMFPGL